MTAFLALLLGRCQHAKLTRVFTDMATRRKYVKCVACGVAFAYDWAEMRIGKPLVVQPAAVGRRAVEAEAVRLGVNRA